MYLSHLFFANDYLLFFKKDNKSFQNILQWYCNLSGQNINLAKSYLFCSPNMPKDEQISLPKSLQVNLVLTPSKYLGLDFKLRGKIVSDFQFLVNKLKSKLQSWKSRLLSQANRGTLITSVLQTLPIYTFSCFKVPKTICKRLDSVIINFWWGHEQGVNKLHLVHWDKMCQNRKEGGIGFKKFNLMNQAMLAKQFWRIS